jgi:transglutaminase-like putative cysteine protease
MRFGFVHRLMTDALAALGLLALLTSGELDAWITIALVVGGVLALLVPDSWQESEGLRKVGVFAPVALLLFQASRLGTGAEPLPIAVEFAAGLQVIRLATRRGAAHDQQVVVLALLHLIAGTVLGGGIAYGLCFLGFLVVAPGALVLSHLRREVEGNYRQGARDRTGLPVDVPRILRSRRVIGRQFLLFTCALSIPIFLFTASLFVAFPRVGLSLLLLNHGRPERMVGFSDRVDLGGVGKLRTDPSIALRVDIPGLPEEPPPRIALYLRGTAFDAYDGRTWVRTLNYRRVADLRGATLPILRAPLPEDRSLTLDLEAIDPPVLFLPDDAVAVELLSQPTPLIGRAPRLFSGPEGQVQYVSTEESGIRYRVFTSEHLPQAEPLPATDRARYLTLPPGLPQRAFDLAERWTRGVTTPLEMARAVERHLRTEYRYDLESPSGGAANPLDHFLFESQRGHCEFYSTAMAVLLRTRGIPTRNVTGFVGGTYNRFGRYYAVRQGDAHSWVEVYLPDRGWTRFDPTPPSNAVPQSELTGVVAFLRDVMEAAAQRWNRHVRGYDLAQQIQLLSAAQRRFSGFEDFDPRAPSPKQLGAIAGALVLGAAVFMLLRRRYRATHPLPPRRALEQAQLEHVVALYRALEAALAERGVPRAPSTPPLAHARALFERQHPLAAEVLELTELYLEARFGDQPLSVEQQRHFARRIRALRRDVHAPAPHAA